MRAGFLILFLIVISGLAGIGSAQMAVNATDEPDAEYIAQVDGVTRIVKYDHQAGTFSVVIEADRPRLVVLSDVFGAVSDGGGVAEVRTKRVTIPTGTSRLEMPVGKYRGTAAVTVATARGAVSLTVDDSTPIIGGPYSARDTQVAGLGGLVAGIGLVGVIAYRRVRGLSSGVRRVL